MCCLPNSIEEVLEMFVMSFNEKMSLVVLKITRRQDEDAINGFTIGKMGTQTYQENGPSCVPSWISWQAKDFDNSHEVAADDWKIKPVVMR